MKFEKIINTELLGYFLDKLKALFVAKESGKGLSTNDFTTEEKTKLEGLTNYTHPDSGVTPGTYKSVTVDAKGHVTGGSNPTTLEGYGITDAADAVHSHGANDITSVNADSIVGVIPIENLPKSALERIYVVTDDEDRLALTTEQVQNGDTVKVNNTGLMYFVKDDTKLNSEDGYEQYTAGAASTVTWGGITGKPESFPPSEHTHTTSQITDFPEAMKNPNALSIQLNGDDPVSYDGSAAKSVNVTAGAIGALTESDIVVATTSDIDSLFV